MYIFNSLNYLLTISVTKLQKASTWPIEKYFIQQKAPEKIFDKAI